MSIGIRRRPRALAGAPAGAKLLLHVGSGPPDPGKLPERFQAPDWHEVRLDIDPEMKPDIVGTIVDMSAVTSASVDAVWSSHNLEHVHAHEVARVLHEFVRVLRPGGEVLILVPDLQKVAEAVARGNLEGTFYEAEAGPIAALDVLYGHGDSIARGRHYMAHKTGFTAKTLDGKLRSAGFRDVGVKRERIALLWASGRKPE